MVAGRATAQQTTEGWWGTDSWVAVFPRILVIGYAVSAVDLICTRAEDTNLLRGPKRQSSQPSSSTSLPDNPKVVNILYEIAKNSESTGEGVKSENWVRKKHVYTSEVDIPKWPNPFPMCPRHPAHQVPPEITKIVRVGKHVFFRREIHIDEGNSQTLGIQGRKSAAGAAP